MVMVKRAATINTSGVLEWEDEGPGSFFVTKAATGTYDIVWPTDAVDANSIAVIATPYYAGTSAANLAIWTRVSDITVAGCRLTNYGGSSLSNNGLTVEVAYEEVPQIPNGGWSQPFPNSERDIGFWVPTNANVIINSGDIQFSFVNASSGMPPPAVSYPATLTPGIAFRASVQGKTGSGSVVRYLRVGTTQGGNDLGEYTFASNWADEVGVVDFTSPASGQTWVTVALAGPNVSLVTSRFTNASCLSL